MPLLRPEVEPLWIARYDYEPGWSLPLHSHDDYFQLIHIVSGTGQALIGAERQPFRAGQMLFFRPRFKHGLLAGGAGPVRTIDTKFIVHSAKLRAACRRLGAFHQSSDERVVALLEDIHAEARRHGSFTKDICQTLFTHLLLRLLQNESNRDLYQQPARSATPTEDDHLAKRMERYLRENCASHIDQRSLSAAFNYTYRHLLNVWHRHHRDSPIQALWHYRVTRASQLIRYSDFDLKQVAELTGFASVHHFTRVFSRIAGVSPSRWRQREREGIRQDIVIRTGFKNPALTIQSPASRRKRAAEAKLDAPARLDALVTRCSGG